jgi:hypothetical protein
MLFLGWSNDLIWKPILFQYGSRFFVNLLFWLPFALLKGWVQDWLTNLCYYRLASVKRYNMLMALETPYPFRGWVQCRYQINVSGNP